MDLRASGATDVGRVRELNEDAFLIADQLFVVCDGLGGHQAGEVASRTAVQALRDAFSEPTLDNLVLAVRWANRAVWQLAQEQPDKRGMGTTLTAVAVIAGADGDGTGEADRDGDQLAVVNVGDSRTYLMRDGELTQLTEDHSLVNELVQTGELTAEEAAHHPQRSVITRALGLDNDIEVDSIELLPYRGDRLLLCSDGLTNEVTDDKVGATLRRLADPDEAAKDLIRQARANGGSDNITVVVLDVVDDEGKAEQASAALADDPPTDTDHTVVVPDADDEDEPVASAGRQGTRGERRRAKTAGAVRPRRFTWRVALFALLLLAVLGGAVAAVGWYARRTFYVGLQGDQVVVFKGRPGGLLWFDPTVEKRTGLTGADVPQVRLPDLRDGVQEATRADADRYVNRLREEAQAQRQAQTPPPLSLPTTTVPQPTVAGPTPPPTTFPP